MRTCGIGLDDPCESWDQGKGGGHQLAKSRSKENHCEEGMKGRVQDPGRGLPCPVGRRGRCCNVSWMCCVAVGDVDGGWPGCCGQPGGR